MYRVLSVEKFDNVWRQSSDHKTNNNNISNLTSCLGTNGLYDQPRDYCRTIVLGYSVDLFQVYQVTKACRWLEIRMCFKKSTKFLWQHTQMGNEAVNIVYII